MKYTDKATYQQSRYPDDSNESTHTSIESTVDGQTLDKLSAENLSTGVKRQLTPSDAIQPLPSDAEQKHTCSTIQTDRVSEET